ncbi:peroxisomal membrane protein Pex25p [[Candida] anglica]|uniref:Peroxisomal membrane protein Pex25p n=1 Tax=[Candida] anglica TaxID=148631 RepID=A0ABP0E681_9ASCO
MEIELDSTSTTIHQVSKTSPSRLPHHHHQTFSGNYIFSTQPHTSPLIHTLHSEWIDSPLNSPTKQMSSSYTKVYETPSKSKALNFITPVSDAKDASKRELSVGPFGRPNTPPVTSETINNNNITTVKKQVKSMDIFWDMLNDVTGKDKLAKFGQYALRLLIHWANRSETYLSDSQINIKSINLRYNNREKKLNLFMNFLKHPQNFVRVIIVLVCSIFSTKFAGMVKGLSMYRQFLRFGKTPFRVRKLLGKFNSSLGVTKDGIDYLDLDNFNKQFLNKSTLGDVLGLYYGMNDESLLLYKLNFLTNKRLHRIVSRHESLAWYYDTIFGLYNAYGTLQDLSSKEFELKIQIQVKSRARVLSKQLLGGVATHNNENPNIQVNDDKDLMKLKEIQFKKHNAYLDIYKGLSDFIFNSYTVFNARLPFDTLQIWMGISASTLSIVKIYRETKKRLEAKN